MFCGPLDKGPGVLGVVADVAGVFRLNRGVVPAVEPVGCDFSREFFEDGGGGGVVFDEHLFDDLAEVSEQGLTVAALEVAEEGLEFGLGVCCHC